MRPPFSAPPDLRKRAKEGLETGLGRLRRWWMTKYRLPTSDPLFQNQTEPDLILEYYEDLYEEKATIAARLEADPGAKDQGSMRERLRVVAAALEETEDVDGEDDLVDFWEQEIAAGRTPDLAMLPSDVKTRGRRK